MINNSPFPLKLGSNGKAVQIIQLKAGLPITGIYDITTQSFVMSKFRMTIVSSKLFMSIFTGISADEIDNNFPIQGLSNGFYVTCLEILLGIEQSGVFNWKTDQALRKATGQEFIRYDDFIALVRKMVGLAPIPIQYY